MSSPAQIFLEALELHKAGDLAAAVEAYRRVLRAGRHPGAGGNLGLALWRMGDATAGEQALREALAWAPDHAPNHFNLGNLLWWAGRLGEAAAELRRAAALGMDDARLNLANVLLALGQYREGWAMFEVRPEHRTSEAHRLGFPEWRGEPLEGKRLFVWVEQGFGDQLFAARFVRQLAGVSVTLAAPSQLARLFRQLPAEIVPRSPETAVAPHDYWTLPLSLPRWLPEPIPTAPYLSGTPKSSGGIGVVWRGNAMPDPGRSLPASLAGRLLGLPGALSLLPEDTGARDFQDTADLIAGLDLVVTIDTSVAHLAGAMGRPCWLLLQHHGADWRWRPTPEGRSALYPSVRLFRQPGPGDWIGALDAIDRELASTLG